MPSQATPSLFLHGHEAERETDVDQTGQEEGGAVLDAQQQAGAEGDQDVAERVGEVLRRPERQEGGTGDALRHAAHVLVVVGKGSRRPCSRTFDAGQQGSQAEEKAEEQEGGGVFAAHLGALGAVRVVHEFRAKVSG
jgi:hypothetical protein